MKKKFPYELPKINFDKETHTYTSPDIEDSSKIISVTTFLSKDTKFDALAISEKVSKNPSSEYYNIHPSIIRSMWNKITEDGDYFHTLAENCIDNGGIENKFILDKFLENKFLKKKFNNLSKVHTEVKLFSRKLLLAGTSDLVIETDTGLEIYDYKTCKNLTDDKKFKYYQQILLYTMMLREAGIPVKAGGIIWIKNWNKENHTFAVEYYPVSKEQYILENLKSKLYLRLEELKN